MLQPNPPVGGYWEAGPLGGDTGGWGPHWGISILLRTPSPCVSRLSPGAGQRTADLGQPASGTVGIGARPVCGPLSDLGSAWLTLCGPHIPTPHFPLPTVQGSHPSVLPIGGILCGQHLTWTRPWKFLHLSCSGRTALPFVPQHLGLPPTAGLARALGVVVELCRRLLQTRHLLPAWWPGGFPRQGVTGSFPGCQLWGLLVPLGASPLHLHALPPSTPHVSLCLISLSSLSSKGPPYYRTTSSGNLPHF